MGLILAQMAVMVLTLIQHGQQQLQQVQAVITLAAVVVLEMLVEVQAVLAAVVRPMLAQEQQILAEVVLVILQAIAVQVVQA
jgi:hypothetical protein